MEQPFYFLTDSYESFRNVMTNLAQNAPDMCEHLIVRALNSLNVEPVSYAHPPVENPYSPNAFHDFIPLHATGEEALSVGVERFLSWCTDCRKKGTLEKDPIIERFLYELYGRRAGTAMDFLLAHANEETQKEFAASYLGSDIMAQQATVDIIVRKNNLWARWGNKGRYVIYTRKGSNGEETLLKFTNQPSAVYYLMFLVDYVRKADRIPYFMMEPVDLHRNRSAFCEIYNIVYNLKYEESYQRFQKLLYREDEHGKIRAGRQNEITNDIRRTMAKTFDAYDESFVPYVMSSLSHLSVPVKHIIFEDDASELLDVYVK